MFEALYATGALYGFSLALDTGIRVFTHVVYKLTTCIERLGTHGTLEWLFASVASYVYCHLIINIVNIYKQWSDGHFERKLWNIRHIRMVFHLYSIAFILLDRRLKEKVNPDGRWLKIYTQMMLCIGICAFSWSSLHFLALGKWCTRRPSANFWIFRKELCSWSTNSRKKTRYSPTLPTCNLESTSSSYNWLAKLQ